MSSYFKQTDTIDHITTTYPETIDVLIRHGFDQLSNPMIRKTIGKSMTLKTICTSKKVDIVALCDEMDATISKHLGEKLVIKGVLPCPIRLPLLDQINDFIQSNDLQVDYTLPAASTGLDWLIAETSKQENLADVYLSAGFGLFFDRQKIGKFIKEGVFAPINHAYNHDFQNDHINFEDPNHLYTILGVVPAIFIIQKKLLGDRPIPQTWADLFDAQFHSEVAIPMKDLDLFNAVLLNIYATYGADGVKALGRSMAKDMHPAQMVKNTADNRTPPISIAPYFFASMIKEGDDQIAVWPKDGAVASPIFLLAKKERFDKCKPFISFLQSPQIGSILSANGKFPSSVKGVDNHLTDDQPMMFCGFDFLEKHDVARLLIQLENLFLGKVDTL